MIKRFVRGRWYKCLKKNRGYSWNSKGLMDGVLDGKPHKCTKGYEDCAVFEDVPFYDRVGWWMWDLEDFVEVKLPKSKSKGGK